jgi:hypothetical protein
MDPKQRNRTILIIAAVFILIGLVTFIISSMLKSREQITVDSVPTDLILTMDGKKVKNAGAIGVQPGTYTFEGKRQGFKSKTVTITLKDKEKKTMRMYLDPDSAQANEWLSKNEEEALKWEAQKGQEHNAKAAQAVKDNPLLSELPYIGGGYKWRIDAGVTEPGAKYPDQMTIYVRGKTQADRNDALLWIKSGGYDIEKMNIKEIEVDPATL